MPVHQMDTDLYLVDLDQNLTGFRHFISSWIYRRDGRTIVIDPGPASTIPELLKALDRLGVEDIDHILLTHVHIDHAGGAGQLLKAFPSAHVHAHPKGIPHMIDPEKLWQGSLKILGKIAEAYGPVTPIPGRSISFSPEISWGDARIAVTETPGHASHHVCYEVNGVLFAGEVAGVRVPEAGDDYLRIATPPVFIYEVYRDSLLRAAQLDVNQICFGHYGASSEPQKLFRSAEAQLHLWMEKGRRHFEEYAEDKPELLLAALLKEDPALAGFNTLPEDIRSREQYFCLNSIKGILGYFRKQAEKQLANPQSHS